MRASLLRRDLSRFLAEDIGTGDVTGALLPRGLIRARVVSRGDGIAAGVAFARELFVMRGCRASVKIRDGGALRGGRVVMEVAGDRRRVLECERTALNLLSRMSGIATQTSRMARMLPAGTGLYATRKTAPGLRRFDKEAVRIGGGHVHRMGLDSGVMIKDNHIAAAAAAAIPAGRAPDAGVAELVARARRRGHRAIEVEVETVDGAVEAARAGASVVMLDNFTPARILRAVAALTGAGLRGRVKLEASGGISGRNIARYARTGVDMISVGALTNSAAAVDLSLEVVKPAK